MLRAIAKGTMLAGFGRVPKGAPFYTKLTRKYLGTAASHVVKLTRVWPHYVDTWKSLCAMELEGSTIWIHEPGATPFSLLAAYAVTGSAGLASSENEPMLNRYVARSVNAVLESGLATGKSSERLRKIEAARWQRNCYQIIDELGGQHLMNATPTMLQRASDSADICHSGGVLEHYRPKVLDGFLAECYRILKPGGIASHVFDHRDHLFHADKRIPFGAHLAFPEGIYEALFGHALAYHSRLSPTEVIECFEKAGFQKVAVRRLILPSQTFVPDHEVSAGKPALRRALLASRFRAITDEDLATAAAHYLFRKPFGHRHDGKLGWRR